MVAHDANRPSPTCPDEEELSAFTRGQLSEARLETIADHVALCLPCASTLHAMQGMDTLVNQLRHHPPPLAHQEETECVQLVHDACAIPQAKEADSTVSTAEPTGHQLGPRLPADFGAYVLLEEVGRAGQSVVYKAQQKALKWLVAVKLVRAGVYASADERTRFQRDGISLARIHHPHVVQIHDFGEHQGQLYYSMELLEGGTLTERLKGQPLPQRKDADGERQAAELVRTLAQTVEEVHLLGIVHRDLKPSNVMFTADGVVKITDFGLAKVLDDESNETISEAILGTPPYMAPEQARGEIRKIGPATDVYGLGAILYEALTNRPPFQGQDKLQTLALVCNQEPTDPSHYRPGLSRELEAICLKCLEKEPGKRYPSAAELAEDLGRWLRGETTQARPRKWPIRLWRQILRHPLLVSAAALLLFLALAVPTGLWYRDPDHLIKTLESRLRRGEQVTLIGDSGPPAWSHWELRQGAIDVSPWGDSAFTFNTLEPAFLTLLRDPQGSYRFSARVRHGPSYPLSEVGLLFLYSRHNTQRGLNHCFCNLVFSDREALTTDPQTGAACSRVSCNLWRCDPGSKSSILLADHFFSPALDGDKFPWRELAVEVRPEGLELFWEGKSFARVPHARILEDFQGRKLLRAGLQMFDAYPELQPTFTPRDALGLYVNQGKASFQHVVVQPLP